MSNDKSDGLKKFGASSGDFQLVRLSSSLPLGFMNYSCGEGPGRRNNIGWGCGQPSCKGSSAAVEILTSR